MIIQPKGPRSSICGDRHVVEVDGVEHEVTSYLAKELNADDMKMNLK